MTHHVVKLDDALKAVDEAHTLLETLRDEVLTIEAETVSARRSAAQERARVKTDLSYASHLLELARVQVDHQHQRITRAAKGVETQ